MGLQAEFIEGDWRGGADPEKIEAYLAEDKEHQIKAVFATQNEPATGVKSDVEAVRKALDDANHPALLFVDGVSSIGSVEFEMDKWGVDCAVSGSQKGGSGQEEYADFTQSI